MAGHHTSEFIAESIVNPSAVIDKGEGYEGPDGSSKMPSWAVPPSSRTRSEPSAHVQDLEKSFARHLGMRVQIRPSAAKGKGRVVIHYASLDQFDTLLSRLGKPC